MRFLALAAAMMLLLAGCDNDSTTSGIDLTPFKTMAASTPDCTDVSNRLFLIDESSVFWDRRGSCVDGLYTFALFGRTVNDVLCERHDAIGGGNVTSCTDESYRPMFETITANLGDPQLGLGREHGVQSIPF